MVIAFGRSDTGGMGLNGTRVVNNVRFLWACVVLERSETMLVKVCWHRQWASLGLR